MKLTHLPFASGFVLSFLLHCWLPGPWHFPPLVFSFLLLVLISPVYPLCPAYPCSCLTIGHSLLLGPLGVLDRHSDSFTEWSKRSINKATHFKIIFPNKTWYFKLKKKKLRRLWGWLSSCPRGGPALSSRRAHHVPPTSSSHGHLHTFTRVHTHMERKCGEEKENVFPLHNKSKTNNRKGKMFQNSGFFSGSWIPRWVSKWSVAVDSCGSCILGKLFSTGVWLSIVKASTPSKGNTATRVSLMSLLQDLKAFHSQSSELGEPELCT